MEAEKQGVKGCRGASRVFEAGTGGEGGREKRLGMRREGGNNLLEE